jgi:hypothetical protein
MFIGAVTTVILKLTWYDHLKKMEGKAPAPAPAKQAAAAYTHTFSSGTPRRHISQVAASV